MPASLSLVALSLLPAFALGQVGDLDGLFPTKTSAQRCEPTPVVDDPKCYPLMENWERVRSRLLNPATPSGAAVASTPWNHVSPPRHLDLVSRRFSLTPAELTALTANGFAVLDRLHLGTYALAYHEIFQSQLPIYVSVDSLLHATFVSHETFVTTLERRQLAPLLGEALQKMIDELPAASREWPAETTRDVSLYLAVAAELLTDEPPPADLYDPAEPVAVKPPMLGEEETAIARKLVDEMHSARGVLTVELFGRPRLVDFARYKPRGPYANPALQLGSYYRAATWLSRLEFNLVSRACRSSHPGPELSTDETPREVAAALALSQLATRAHQLDALATLDRAWTALAGPRPDVSFAELAMFAGKASVTGPQDPAAAQKLALAIGDKYRRTLRTHPMPEGASGDLPVIATLLVPRLGVETGSVQQVVHGAVPERDFPTASDVAYVLGHDRALTHLAPELARFPELRGQLEKARASLATQRRSGDLQSLWFSAVRSLADRPVGPLPSFMATPAFADLRLASAIAGFGQVKHAYVLMAGDTYGEGGCEIPEGWVEPVPTVLDALLEYHRQAGGLARAVGDKEGEAHFRKAIEILQILRRIVADELAGRALTREQRQFLSMVMEVPPFSYSPHCKPYFEGWYRHLFYSQGFERSEFREPGFIASYFTGPKGIAYVGARAPRIGIFVVDSAGPARVAVGPVADVYEHQGASAGPLTDAEAVELKGTRAPWSESFRIAAPVAPRLRVEEDEAGAFKITREGGSGPVSLVRRGEHREVLETLTKNVGATPVTFKFKQRTGAGLEVRVGDFSEIRMCSSDYLFCGEWTLGGMKSAFDTGEEEPSP